MNIIQKIDLEIYITVFNSKREVIDILPFPKKDMKDIKYYLYKKGDDTKQEILLQKFENRLEFYRTGSQYVNISCSLAESEERIIKNEDLALTLKINYDDFIGVEMRDSELVFYSTYFPREGCCSCKQPSKRVRKIMEHVFVCEKDTHEKLRDEILESFSLFCKKNYNAGKIEHPDNQYDLSGIKSYEKRVLVIINPVGGQGKALQIYESMEKYIKSSGILPTVFQTKHFKHAYEFIRDMEKEDFIKYYAIVTVAGDGIAHEITNAFYNRLDHQELTLRISCLNGGSACGLASSCTREWSLDCTQDNCVYVLIRSRFNKSKIIKYDINDDRNLVVYGNLCFLYGF